MKDLGRVSMFAAGNLGLAGISNFLDKASQFLHLLVTLGQVGVAAITMVYVLKQIKALRKPKK